MIQPIDTDVSTSPVALFRLFADETRWRVIQALRQSDRSVRDLVALVQAPQSLVSYHLQTLRDANLVTAHKSDADGRTIYYGLNVASMAQVQNRLAEALHIPQDERQIRSNATVLFVCSQNSARSQMAEGWLRALGPDSLRIRSAGLRPSTVNPLAVEVMAERNIDIGHQSAKSIDTFDGLAPDVLVTVCDLAKEPCTSRLTAPQVVHWSIPDPAATTGTDENRRSAFRVARDDIEQRVRGLLGVLPAIS